MALPKRAIESFDSSGNVVHSFDSITAAHLAGLNRQVIHRVLRGDRDRYRGMGWRYSDPPAPKPPMGKLSRGQIMKIASHLRSLLPQDSLSPVQIADIERTLGELQRRLANPSCLLSAFIAERCHAIDGAMIKFCEFFEAFQVWMKDRGEPRGNWHRKQKVINAMAYSGLAVSFPYGVRHSNIRSIGNLSFNANTLPTRPLVLVEGRLKPR